MAGKLDGKRIAILATDGVEEAELVRPRDAVTAEGAQVDVVSLQDGAIQAMNHDIEPASTVTVDVTAAQASPSDYDALILPADGERGPAADGRRRALVRAGDLPGGKPVGAICHGPWTLIDAGVVEGRTLTSYPSLRTDLTNAGAKWVDEEVVTDAGAGVQPQPRRPRRVLPEDRRGVRGGRHQVHDQATA
jgi:protease I